MAAFECPVSDDAGMVRVLLGNVDCSVGGFVESAYGALSRPGSPVMLLLTALLTIYVAFIGYRLLLGRSRLSVGDTAVSALKIGVVLALATSWGTYQGLVYESLYEGPQALAAGLLDSLQPGNSAFRGDPMAGLQLAFDTMQGDADLFAKRAGVVTASPFVGGPAFGAMSLNLASMLLLISTLGVLLASKLVLAILLALAPVLAGLLLFDATRNMVAGWLKAMVALALLPLTAILVLAVELTMIEPSLSTLADNVQAGNYALTPVNEIGLLILVFTFVLTAAVLSGVAIARGLRLPWGGDAAPAEAPAFATAVGAPAQQALPTIAAPPRATRIAAAAAAVSRREMRADLASRATSTASRGAVVAAASRDRGAAAGELRPLGQGMRRPTQPRSSAAAQRRDR